MTDEVKITEADQKLAHTVLDHLILETYNGMLTAYEEAALMKGEDDRFKKLYVELQDCLDQLDDIINSALDTIPGLPSRQEAEVMAREALDKMALLQGLPGGSLTPDKETLH